MKYFLLFLLVLGSNTYANTPTKISAQDLAARLAEQIKLNNLPKGCTYKVDFTKMGEFVFSVTEDNARAGYPSVTFTHKGPFDVRRGSTQDDLAARYRTGNLEYVLYIAADHKRVTSIVISVFKRKETRGGSVLLPTKKVVWEELEAIACN